MKRGDAHCVTQVGYQLHESTLLDSGTTGHIFNSPARFTTLRMIEPDAPDDYYGTGGGNVPIRGWGTVTMRLNNGQMLTLKDCAFCPTMPTNLLSIAELMKINIYWCPRSGWITRGYTPVHRIKQIDNYFIWEVRPIRGSHIVLTKTSFVMQRSHYRRQAPKSTPNEAGLLLHLRTGHAGPQVLQHLDGAKGIGAIGPTTYQCTSCGVGKITKPTSRAPPARLPQRAFEEVTIDMHPMQGDDNCPRYILITDRLTNYVRPYFPPNGLALSTLQCINDHYAWCLTQTGTKWKMIRGDGELKAGVHQRWRNSRGIVFQSSPAYTAEPDGHAEVMGRWITEKARTMRIHAKLPEDMWTECISAACFLYNRLPNAKLSWMSPLQAINLQQADDDQDDNIDWCEPYKGNMHAYGCRAYVMKPGMQKTHDKNHYKMNPRADIGYLVGYVASNIYRIWIPHTGKIRLANLRTARDVHFDETKFFDTHEPRLQQTLLSTVDEAIELYTSEARPDIILPTPVAGLEEEFAMDDMDENDDLPRSRDIPNLIQDLERMVNEGLLDEQSDAESYESMQVDGYASPNTTYSVDRDDEHPLDHFGHVTEDPTNMCYMAGRAIKGLKSTVDLRDNSSHMQRAQTLQHGESQLKGNFVEQPNVTKKKKQRNDEVEPMSGVQQGAATQRQNDAGEQHHNQSQQQDPWLRHHGVDSENAYTSRQGVHPGPSCLNTKRHRRGLSTGKWDTLEAVVEEERHKARAASPAKRQRIYSRSGVHNHDDYHQVHPDRRQTVKLTNQELGSIAIRGNAIRVIELGHKVNAQGEGDRHDKAHVLDIVATHLDAGTRSPTPQQSTAAASKSPTRRMADVSGDKGRGVEPKVLLNSKKSSDAKPNPVTPQPPILVAKGGEKLSGSKHETTVKTTSTPIDALRPIGMHRAELPPAPNGLSHARKHKYKDHWLLAEQEHLKEHENIGTFTITTRDEAGRHQVIDHRWVYVYKFNEKDELVKFKARIVARGDQESKTAEDTYAATLAARTFRIVMAMVAEYDLETQQYDVSNAFVNAPLERTVYMKVPRDHGSQKQIWRLNRALYGLRVSPLLWQRLLSATFEKLGFKAVPQEPCCMMKGEIIVFFYVDDIGFAYPSYCKAEVDLIAKDLCSRYKVTGGEEIKWFLGINVLRDRSQRKLWLSQATYVDKVFALCDEKESNSRFKTPIINEELIANTGKADDETCKAYQRKTGSLQYSAVETRPDTSFAVSRLARHNRNPSPEHVTAANRVCHYLKNTRGYAIQYGGYDKSLPALRVASDAAFADNTADRRSSHGYMVMLFGGAISWKAGKQSTVTTSTTEAELVSLSEAARECIFISRLLRNLGKRLKEEPSVMLPGIDCDNQTTVNLVTKEYVPLNTRLRHIDIHNHWLRQEIKEKRIQVQWVPTMSMIADGLTKAYTEQQMKAFRTTIGMVDITNMLEQKT